MLLRCSSESKIPPISPRRFWVDLRSHACQRNQCAVERRGLALTSTPIGWHKPLLRVPPTTMAVSLVEAEMLALCLGLFLNGIYVVTMGIAGRVLLTNPEGRLRSAREINWVLLTVFVALFLNDMMDTVLEIVQAMNAFVLYTGPGGAEHVFLRGSSSITLAKTASVGVQTLMGDAILIWRCWFIWKSKTWLVIILPIIAWIANFVLNAYVDVLLSRVFQGLVFSSAIQPWGEAFWIIAICINTFTTGLIVFRLWEVESTNVQFREPSSMNTSFSDRTKTPLGRAMRNIVESGMLITVSSLLMCIAYSTQSNFNYPASTLASSFHSLVGIAFNLIIIRGAKRRNRAQNQTGAASIHFNTNPLALGSTRAEIHTTTTVITDANLKQERFSLAPMPKRSASVEYV
ncbi:Carboxylic ester hydrolase [Mycena chlorophos]|uniref:Carboxylic ester hydrolase n=1 Tax=Mycena chlorophos TaxID=658473 RepID=A0A8H6ST87_MYCCL|nr:Carboxylic ester hydrolase [Mycena chlorophos]